MVRRGLADEGVLGRRSVEIGRLVDRKLTRVHAADRGELPAGRCRGRQPGRLRPARGRGLDRGRDRGGRGAAGAPGGDPRVRALGQRGAQSLALRIAAAAAASRGTRSCGRGNLRRRGLINGERATVERIAGVRIDVRTHSGRRLRFAVDDDDLRHIDPRLELDRLPGEGLTRGTT